MARFPLWLALGCALLCARIVAAETPAPKPPPTLTGAQLATALEASLQRGDFKQLGELAAPYVQNDPPRDLPPRGLTDLGIALQGTQARRALAFFRAAAKDTNEYPRATSWLIETLLATGQPGLARREWYAMYEKLRSSAPVSYAFARIAYDEYDRLPQAEQRRRREALKKAESQSSGLLGRGHFDPRYLSLEMELLMEKQDYAGAARVYAEFLKLRPLHSGAARRMLALSLNPYAPEPPEKFSPFLTLARTALPADELARWTERLERNYAVRHDPSRAIAYAGEWAVASLSDRPADADFAGLQAILVERAAARCVESWRPWLEHQKATAEGKPAPEPGSHHLAASVERFATQARRGSSTIALRALEYIDLARRTPAGVKVEAETELALCYLARDYVRGAPLAAAALPGKLEDFRWLRSTWQMFEAGPAPAREKALAALKRLKPDDGFVLRAVARAELEPESQLAAYTTFFNLPPASGTAPEDWTTYRRLLNDADERAAMLDAREKRRDAAFDPVVRRWAKALPDDVVVAEQAAHLAIREANRVASRPNVEAAHKAVRDAMILGCENTAITHSADKLRDAVDKYASDDRDRKRAEEARLAAEAESARQRAAEQASRNQAYAQNRLARVERLEARAAYIEGVGDEVTELAAKIRSGNYDFSARQQFQRGIENLKAIAANMCVPCQGLGAQRSSTALPACPVCGGTGKKNRSGPGPSAGFEK